jgi:hypothetical protein
MAALAAVCRGAAERLEKKRASAGELKPASH